MTLLLMCLKVKLGIHLIYVYLNTRALIIQPFLKMEGVYFAYQVTRKVHGVSGIKQSPSNFNR